MLIFDGDILCALFGQNFAQNTSDDIFVFSVGSILYYVYHSGYLAFDSFECMYFRIFEQSCQYEITLNEYIQAGTHRWDVDIPIK